MNTGKVLIPVYQELLIVALNGETKLAPDLFPGFFDEVDYKNSFRNVPGKQTPAGPFMLYALGDNDYDYQEIFEEKGQGGINSSLTGQSELRELLEWYPECVQKGFEVLVVIADDENSPVLEKEEEARVCVAIISRNSQGQLCVCFDHYKKKETLYAPHKTLVIKRVKTPILPHIRIIELEEELA